MNRDLEFPQTQSNTLKTKSWLASSTWAYWDTRKRCLSTPKATSFNQLGHCMYKKANHSINHATASRRIKTKTYSTKSVNNCILSSTTTIWVFCTSGCASLKWQLYISQKDWNSWSCHKIPPLQFSQINLKIYLGVNHFNNNFREIHMSMSAILHRSIQSKFCLIWAFRCIKTDRPPKS